MRGKLITGVAVLGAVVGWWGIYELIRLFAPDQPGALSFFYALLFLAVTATLVPAAAYLNRRLAPESSARDSWRFLRQSAWGGICATVWAWLQMHRTLNLGFAVITLLIAVAVEVLIARLRAEEEVTEPEA